MLKSRRLKREKLRRLREEGERMKKIKIIIEAEVELQPIPIFCYTKDQAIVFESKCNTLKVAEEFRRAFMRYLVFLTTKKYIAFEVSDITKITFDCKEVKQ